MKRHKGKGQRAGIGAKRRHGGFLTIRRMHGTDVPQLSGILRQEERAIEEDFGGLERMSYKERLLLQDTLRAAYVLHSIDHFFSLRGLLDKEGNPDPALRDVYLKYITLHARLLQSLGLRQEAQEKLPTPLEYIRAKAQRVAPNHAGGGEIVAQRGASESEGGE